MAVKIEHSRGRQHHLYSPHSHRSAFLAQKAALGGRDNKCIHSLLVRRCEEVVRFGVEPVCIHADVDADSS